MRELIVAIVIFVSVRICDASLGIILGLLGISLSLFYLLSLFSDMSSVIQEFLAQIIVFSILLLDLFLTAIDHLILLLNKL